MKKKLFAIVVFVMSFVALPVGAISEGQESAIKNHCDTIRDSLRKVQRDDSRTRVYLGGYYENILTGYMMPLNVKLVENNMSSVSLVENQNNFATTKGDFVANFVNYQKGLEELIAMDCKNEPDKFYEKLTSVRKKRKVVEQNVKKMKELMTEQVKLVEELRKEVQ